MHRIMLTTVKSLVLVLCYVVPVSEGRGLLLLYRPRDVTSDCALSENLRFDLSFGMGMSDTITLVFRTLAEIDYECEVDIATENKMHLLIVIRFPSSIAQICKHNPYAFTILKKETCINLCESIPLKGKTQLFSIALKSRFRFRFVSNSSINIDMQAHLYEVTATAARHINETRRGVCEKFNETFCIMEDESFCFTSGAVCDGITNCGVYDWFDERAVDCIQPDEELGSSLAVAVAAVLACALLAAVHITIKCLPPKANFFYIFNINEDNKLCIEPVFEVASGSLPQHVERARRHSIIPVEYDSSSSSTQDSDDLQAPTSSEVTVNKPSPQKKNTMKMMVTKIQEKIKNVATRNKNTAEFDSEPNISTRRKTKTFIA